VPLFQKLFKKIMSYYGEYLAKHLIKPEEKFLSNINRVIGTMAQKFTSLMKNDMDWYNHSTNVIVIAQIRHTFIDTGWTEIPDIVSEFLMLIRDDNEGLGSVSHKKVSMNKYIDDLLDPNINIFGSHIDTAYTRYMNFIHHQLGQASHDLIFKALKMENKLFEANEVDTMYNSDKVEEDMDSIEIEEMERK